MKKFTYNLLLAGCLVIAGSARADLAVTVNTADNTDFTAGMTNFITALNIVSNNGGGATINFNIPGTGPHYIVTPLFGYYGFGALPVWTNVTINGYSQPGSSPNTHSITQANNAVITIYLASTNGECTDLTENGYSGEGAVLPLLGCTNINITGLGFLGFNPNGTANNGDNMYAIALGGTVPSQNIHIYGCRFGLDADNTRVYQFQKDVTSYGAKVEGTNVIGVAPRSANPRAEFNIFIGGYITFDLGGNNDSPFYVMGNFFDVYPDGLHDFNIDGLTHNGVDHIVEAICEFGGPGTNSCFGTDGDGVNDAEERNIIGGCTAANDSNVIEIYGSGPQFMRVCGNYWGVGVDGLTRFTNGGPNMEWLSIKKRMNSTMTFGSDFDGVSDDLEANLICWNNPFNTLYANPAPPPAVIPGPGPNADVWAWFVGPYNSPPFTGWISMRGNVSVNNMIAPLMHGGSDTSIFTTWLTYFGPFMDTTAAATFTDLIPQLSPKTTAADIIGTCPHPNPTNSFTNIFIDVYVLDPEGWTNGVSLVLPGLTDNSTYTNGFPGGRQFLGTFVDNGPYDRDPAVGSFNFNAKALGLAPGTQVTISANYSMDKLGTHNGRTLTSDFSNPKTLRAPIKIVSVTTSGSNVTITWTGGSAPYSLQRRSPLTGVWSTVQSGIGTTTTTYSDPGGPAYYQVLGN